VTCLTVTGCDSESYRLFDSVTVTGHLHLEFILQGGWMGQGKGLYPPSSWIQRIRELELPSSWSLRIRGLEPPSGWNQRIGELELPSSWSLRN
jgi:hypothetical protein